ncbi:MAG: hypothetical protein RLZZ618_4202 [Pseudomonadota bacterium]|jgi:hypothetical protein
MHSFQKFTMNMLRRHGLILLIALTGFSGAAQAQRTGMPVVDFRDIPVSLSSSKTLTSEQVRQAFVAAAGAGRWEVATLANGNLQLTTLKNGKHTLVVDVVLSADKYAVLYSRSEDLNYVKDTSRRPVPLSVAQTSMLEMARAEHAKRFANLPEAKFAVVREGTSIHPSYEAWVHELLGGVRSQLAPL